MRISDWSSDVCSSDLEPRRKQDRSQAHSQPRPVNHTPPQRRENQKVHQCVFEKVHTIGEQRNRTDPGSHGELHAEIGKVEQSHPANDVRSEEHTSELQSLMRISYAVFCLKKKKIKTHTKNDK